MNKMIMAIVPREEGELVLNALIEAGHKATYLETKGGMLRQSQYTLFIAIRNDELDSVRNIIQENCKIDMNIEDRPHEDFEEHVGFYKFGGAVIFIWNLNHVDFF